jgi:uncharacterized protein (TIGR00369 family)
VTIYFAQNQNYDAVVRDSFARQPFMDFVGARLTDLRPGFCELRVSHIPELTQQHGFFHGGLVASLADSAAGYAAFSVYPENSTVLTVDYKVNFLNPSEGETLIAKAEVVGDSNNIYHLKADVYAEKDGAQNHCLTGVFSMMCLLGKSDSANLGRKEEAHA